MPAPSRPPTKPRAPVLRAAVLHPLEPRTLLSQSPYLGQPIAISPTTTTIIQAEHYDLGGEGVAFHDTTPTNKSGAFRTDAVDVEGTTDTGGGHDISYTDTAEWLEYTITVPAAGPYTPAVRVANFAAGGELHLELPGTAIRSPQISVPATGSWRTFASATAPAPMNLPAGTHVLRLSLDRTSSAGAVAAVNWISLTPANPPPPPVQSPFHGAPFAISPTATTVIQAEDYDKGGEGLAYHDTDTFNSGRAYRTDAVDLVEFAPGQYRVSEAKAGEYLEYTIDVTAAGEYVLSAFVSNPAAGGLFHFTLDNVDLTSTISVPVTGSSFNGPFVEAGSRAHLPAGTHVFRLVLDTNAPASTAAAGIDTIRVVPAKPVTLSGTVYSDTNKNGVVDPADPPSPNARFYLTGADGYYDYFDADARGAFSVTVPAGTYRLRVVPRGADGYSLVHADPVDLGFVPASRIGLTLLVPYDDTINVTGRIVTDADTNPATFTVFADANANRAPDPGEPTTTPAPDGSFTFLGLRRGAHYDILPVLPSGHRIVQLAYYPDTTSLFYGPAYKLIREIVVSHASTVTGIVYRDLDADGGRDGDDPAVPGALVYLDTNDNAARDPGEDVAAADTGGFFTLTTLATGTFPVRVDGVPNPTQPASGAVRLATGRSESYSSLYFGLPPSAPQPGTGAATIAGGAIDFDGAGYHGPLAGWTAYIDLNSNNALDFGEPETVTKADGSFRFFALAPGQYPLRLVPGPGYRLTGDQPVIATAAVDTGWPPLPFASLSAARTDRVSGGGSAPRVGHAGVGYLDLNRNGQLDSGEPSQHSPFVFTGLAPGTYRLAFLPPDGGYYIVTPGTPSSYDVTIGPDATEPSNRHFTLVPGSTVTGIVYVDGNADGYPNGTDTGLVGATIYIDANDNGRLDPGEPSQVSPGYGFGQLPAGTYHIRATAPPGYRLTSPSTGVRKVTLAQGELATFHNFGFVRLTDDGRSIVTGRVVTVTFHSATPNPGVTVFADLNRNDARDPGEPAVVTDAGGNFSFAGLPAGTVRLVEIPPPGTHAVDLRTARDVRVFAGVVSGPVLFENTARVRISGTVFYDDNNNGVRDDGDTPAVKHPFIDAVGLFNDTDLNGRRDFYDPGLNLVVAADGSFVIDGLEPGVAYHLRISSGPGFGVTLPTTSPTTNNGFDITAVPGAVIGGFDFLLATGSVTGFAFDDRNVNGVYDPGELPLAGALFFIDYAASGGFEIDFEPGAHTDATGRFVIPNVHAGPQRLIHFPPPGYRRVSPAGNLLNIDVLPIIPTQTPVFAYAPINP